MWQTPKTSWAATDEFRLEPDYERIRGNLEHLQAWAARIARRAELTPMPDESVDGLPYPEFFNRVEENLAAVAAAVCPRAGYETRSFAAGKAVWDWRDLCRIEGMEEQICRDLQAIENSLPGLAFLLGGGTFGAILS